MIQILFRLIILLSCVGSSGLLKSQDFILLEKRGTIKRIKYGLGDEVAFRMKDSMAVYSGRIQSINDSDFIMNDKHFSYNLISKVKNRKPHRFQNQLAIKVAGAGLLIPAIQIANKILFGSAGAFIEKSGYIIAASCLSLATTLFVVQRRWYDLNNGGYLLRRLDTRLLP